MADNLPLSLSNEHVVSLRAEFHSLAQRFALEHNLHPTRVEQELGFIAAHYAAQVGIQGGEYKEWIDARQPVHPTAASNAPGSGSPDHGSGSGPGG